MAWNTYWVEKRQMHSVQVSGRIEQFMESSAYNAFEHTIELLSKTI